MNYLPLICVRHKAQNFCLPLLHIHRVLDRQISFLDSGYHGELWNAITVKDVVERPLIPRPHKQLATIFKGVLTIGWLAKPERRQRGFVQFFKCQ